MKEANIISDVISPEKYVGYADMPNQIFRSLAIEGFDLNLMVVGESGLGKSTFVNNLFSTDIYVAGKYIERTPPIQMPTMEIRSCITTLVEKGIKLRLNLIDTPGFGDCLDNTNCWKNIHDYIMGKNQEYFDWEMSPRRDVHRDPLIHCVIYFVAPTGHRLKQIDIEFMKKIHEIANLIVVIGRSDSLTTDDLAQFKRRILDDIKTHEINLYTFPEAILKTLDDKEKIESYLNRIPYAVVSSNSSIEVNGKNIRCRKFPWGVCEVENIQHCDFLPLRNLLLRTYTSHLIKSTHSIFYEKYRGKNIVSPITRNSTTSPLSEVERERKRQSERIDAAKRGFEEKYAQHLKEIEEKMKELNQSHHDKISQLEDEISSLSQDRSSNSGVSNRENTLEEKKKKKRIF